MHKKIVKLTIPNIISNITVPLLGAVDLAMMGRLNNINLMGAIALGAMVFNFMYWAMGFLRMGTCGFTSQAYGAGKTDELINILGRGILIALVGAFLLWILQIPIIRLALAWVDTDPAVAAATKSYFFIRIWGAPAAIMAFAFSGWFIGMQNTKIPMWIAIFINVCNIGFNYVFVFLFGMQSDGVALGTVLAQYAGLLLTLLIIFTKYKYLLPHFRLSLVVRLKEMKRFMNVNTDIFFRTLLIISVFSFFTAESARYGSEVLVLNTILYQFFIFFSYGMDGFAHAAEAMTGKYIGRGDISLLKKCVKTVFIWGFGMSLLALLVYALGYQNLLRIFTKDIQIHELAKEYYYWILVLPLLSFPAFLWDGVYAGALATKAMLYTMIGATILCFFPIYYLLSSYWGNHALWFALLLFLVVRGLLMTLLVNSQIFKTKAKI